MEKERKAEQLEEEEKERDRFLTANSLVTVAGKRKLGDFATSAELTEYESQRKKLIDDTSAEDKLEHLKKVSPWVPQFTPQAADSLVKAPPKRPPSPFSGQPIRAKDLIPINLEREEGDGGMTRYLCPVSRKTITNQRVVLIKSTGAYMLAETAEQLAYPSMTCPVTGKKFKKEEVLELAKAATGFAASGQVEAKVHRPSIN
ncbi:hypothetical protein EON64_09695 [archaeon]|nr:MAG: hypothetical protein EON64_09695 [archaeon]